LENMLLVLLTPIAHRTIYLHLTLASEAQNNNGHLAWKGFSFFDVPNI